MADPRAIQIHCDGAMDYDPKQTGGNGYIIEFPESIESETITGIARNDGQGIHRLELISLIESMEALTNWSKKNPMLLRKASGIELYTDRISVTDNELTNPYSIRDWRRNKWQNHENKAIKNSDLLDRVDKLRTKLAQQLGGRVSISYKREKKNKVADKLSREGKKSQMRGVRLFQKKEKNITRRLYKGKDIDYSRLSPSTALEVRAYAWERVRKQYEVCFEVCSGEFEGAVIKANIDDIQKTEIHRSHYYEIVLKEIFTHHVTISTFDEIEPTKDEVTVQD